MSTAGESAAADGAGGVHGAEPDPLAAEWVAGPDGVLFRRGARVLLVAGPPGEERLLLVRGHDVDQPGRSWWFTVGGGIDTDEEPHEAALREVREETGLVLPADALTGPVFSRSAVFDFFSRTCRQDEVLYLARLADPPEALGALDDAGWTDVERSVVDELRWFSLDELRVLVASGAEVYPEGLADHVEGLLRDGWDGLCRHLGPRLD